MLEDINVQELINNYAIPWGINIGMALVIYLVGRFVVGILVKLVRKLLNKADYDEMLTDFVVGIVKAVLMLFVIVASLDQLGVDTTSLVAILGAAGLAIGLSLQSSLQNFAAGVMLLVFKPFKKGDYVEAGGTSGSVQQITVFTTKLITPDNKEVIVPNGAIYSDNIINYSAKSTRRVDMVVGIGYDADLKKAKQVLNELIEADERILKDPAPSVAVSELADSSVNFVVRPWVNSADYWGVMFDFYENVKLRFDEESISIPFPQMDVHFIKPNSDE